VLSAGISSFVRNSLMDIITDVLVQATVPGYDKDIETHPFQFIGMLSSTVVHLDIHSITL